MRSVGIVGGHGPETTANSYLHVSNLFREKSSFSPKITTDNCAFRLKLVDVLLEATIKAMENERR